MPPATRKQSTPTPTSRFPAGRRLRVDVVDVVDVLAVYGRTSVMKTTPPEERARPPPPPPRQPLSRTFEQNGRKRVNTQQNTGSVTETNLGGHIAICECGWTSLVHRGPVAKKRKKQAHANTQYNFGMEAALKELRAHQQAEHADLGQAA